MTDFSFVRPAHTKASAPVNLLVADSSAFITVEHFPQLTTEAGVIDFIAGNSTAILCCSVEQMIVSANATAQRLLGLDQAPVSGTRLTDSVGAADRSKISQHIWASSRQPAPVPFECSIIGSGGHVFRAQVSILPLATRAGMLDGYLVRMTETEGATCPSAESVIDQARLHQALPSRDALLASVVDFHLRLAGAWRASALNRQPLSLLRVDVAGLHSVAARFGGGAASEINLWISEVLIDMFPRASSMPTALAYGSFACVLPGGDEVAARTQLGELKERLQVIIDASRAGPMMSLSMGFSTARPHETPGADFSHLMGMPHQSA